MTMSVHSVSADRDTRRKVEPNICPLFIKRYEPGGSATKDRAWGFLKVPCSNVMAGVVKTEETSWHERALACHPFPIGGASMLEESLLLV
jgi:hypothetical protein